MPLNINTEGAGYQNLLSSLQTIRNQLKNNYGPFLNRMDRDQIQALRQNDELFDELVGLYLDLKKIARRFEQ